MDMTTIRLSDCIPFADNPFRVQDDTAMEMLTESIKESGILIPIVVRPMGDKYEILSGHRRVYAAHKAGLEAVPAIVRELTREEAVIFMVDANLQREGLLPSEKGFAYRMKLEAMKHQGKTSAQLGQKQTSVQQIADSVSDSRTQVQRYIRLTYLEKPLLDMVDERRIALTPAVELSYLLPEEQRELLETIESEDCTPSLSQAVRLRKLSGDGLLTMDRIFEIMTEVKGNQVEMLKIPTDRVRRYFKPETTYRQMEEYIVKALEHYALYLKRQRNRDSR